MSDATVLKIFSYLPNPRVWKSLITAELGGVNVEVIGAKPKDLGGWLWDYDARELEDVEKATDNPNARVGRRGFSGTLYKTDAFLKAHPFGTVPAAFSPDGKIGIFESNSILRAIARACGSDSTLYGESDYEMSRVDSFLDAGLVFAREAQVYLLTMDDMTDNTYNRMAAAYEFFLSGIEQALAYNPFVAGNNLSIADISFVCDFSQFLREGHYKEKLAALDKTLISHNGMADFPRSYQHMLDLSEQAAFKNQMGSYLDWFKKENPT